MILFNRLKMNCRNNFIKFIKKSKLKKKINLTKFKEKYIFLYNKVI